MPWEHPLAANARAIIGRATPKIDLNEAANGVFLPRKRGNADLGALHSGGHSPRYIEVVSQRLEAAEKAGRNIRNELQKIADDLVSGLLKVQNAE